MYLVQVDDGLPEVVLLLVEVTHTNLTEVTGVVLIESVSIHRSVYRIGSHLCVEGICRTLSTLVRWWC